MASIAEKKARRAANQKKYQSKPENKARHAAREKAYREAKASKNAPLSPPPQLSDQEKRDRRNARRTLLRDAKRTTPKRIRVSRAGLSDQEKKARRAAQMKQWTAAHPDIARARKAVQNNRQRKRGATTAGDFTRKEWTALCARYNNCCACCKSQAPLTVDHVIPLVQGGTNDIGNIQPLCKTCNQRKGVKTTDYR